MRMISRCLLAALLTSGPAVLAAPVNLTNSGYTENFDAFSSSGSQTLPAGWTTMATTSTSGQAALGAGMSVGVTSGSTTHNHYAVGNGSPRDSALASMSGGGQYKGIDLAITNATGVPLSAFNLSYTAEAWYVRGNSTDVTRQTASDQLLLYVSTTGLSNSWSAFSAASVTMTVTPPTSNVSLNGNLAENQQTVTSVLYTFASPVAAGNTFYIRWFDKDGLNAGGTAGASGSTNITMGVDNVVVAVPEPAALGLLGGLVFAAMRRRR